MKDVINFLKILLSKNHYVGFTGISFGLFDLMIHEKLVEAGFITVSSYLLICFTVFILKDRHYKFCPECDISIYSKRPEKYCGCGIRYVLKCPNCKKKFKSMINTNRVSECVCPNCGKVFKKERKPNKDSWISR